LLPILIFCSCKNYHRNKAHPEISNEDIKNGASLAVVYCQGCHALPDPSLLDAKSWEKGVLPNMGPRLGIFQFNFEVYPSSKNEKALSKNFYPSSPLLSLEEWQDIIDYYIATSPDSLPHQQRPKAIQNNLSLFKAELPAFSYDKPATCFVEVDTSTKEHSLLIADVFKRKIIRINNKLERIDSVNCGGPIVNVDFQSNGMLACDIGVLNPNNGKFGQALNVFKDNNGKMIADSIPLFDSLARPVQITAADLDRDGLTDYLVCEFGNFIGALSWMQNLGNGKYRHHVLRAVPGAIKAYVRDDHHNGLPDIWVLFAQGDEGIWLFKNMGYGKFSEQKLLGFPPCYGSSYFELADFNGDGYPDILYTCGDNGDFSTVLKPYHGLYIYLNDGKNNFRQKYFFPINGCFKAIARDFDGDGDLDIVAISFFADYAHQPEEGFVYLENKGNFEFDPHTLPEGKSGRWLTMDAADLDGDGKVDIVLGNFSVAPSFIKPTVDWKKGPPFLVLRNTGK
jgi:VCBS repeat protein